MQYNDHPMSSQPLYIIIGLAMALLAADVAFAACMRRDPRCAVPAPAPAKSSDARLRVGGVQAYALAVPRANHAAGLCLRFLLWMLAPFYPKEAYARGVSPEVVGFLFAAHPVALLISAQFAPCLMRAVEPFLLLQRTLFLQAIFIAGFGLEAPSRRASHLVLRAVNRFFLGLVRAQRTHLGGHLRPPSLQSVDSLIIVLLHSDACRAGDRRSLYGHGAACCQRSLHPC